MKLIIKSLLTVVTVMLSFMTNAKEPDLNSWTDHQLDLATKTLTLSMPGNAHNKGVLAPRLKADVNLDDRKKFVAGGYVVPVKISWPFDGSFFQGVQGVLQMKVLIESYKGLESPDKLSNLDQLQAWVKENLENAMHRTRKKYPDRQLVGDFEKVSVHDSTWLKYKVPGLGRITQYTLPISGKYYISIRFNYVNNSKDRNPKWMQKADKAVAAIIEKVRLTDK
jgi:hypothetical protein